MAIPPAQRKTYSAPALSKGLDILELMASEPGRLTLKEVADKLKRSKGEIFRMLVVLAERNYISLDPASESYAITLKLFELAHRQPAIQRLSSAAVPVMKRLSQAIEQSCHLVISYEGHGIVVAQHNSPSDRGFSVRLGAEAPLANSCSGHILLAFTGADKRKQMLANAKPKVKITQAELKKMTARVLKQGYEAIDSPQVQGVKDMGYPVFDYSGEVTAALVVPFLEHLDGSNKVDIKRARERLAEAASAISNALGYHAAGN